MSKRSAGNLHIRNEFTDEMKRFVEDQDVDLNQLAHMEQIHGSKATQVYAQNNNKIISGVDGMVTRISGLYLGVNTADCVPLFFYDPVKKTIGVAHAGWKGTIENIAKNVMGKLKNAGSDPKNVRVAIGPHIGGCCYSVTEERAQLFSKEFKNDTVVSKSEGSWKIDLGMANKLQLLHTGVLEAHIDAPIVCTSCQNDTYFSFRKDGKIVGEMLGVIGIKN